MYDLYGQNQIADVHEKLASSEYDTKIHQHKQKPRNISGNCFNFIFHYFEAAWIYCVYTQSGVVFKTIKLMEMIWKWKWNGQAMEKSEPKKRKMCATLELNTDLWPLRQMGKTRLVVALKTHYLGSRA